MGPMKFEILLVTGLVLAALSIVALLNAMIERRLSLSGAFAAVVAAGMLFWAIRSSNGEFGIKDIPEAFMLVVATVFN